ncbi:hypothetical protein IAU59_004726 [Kwoniella sp. CBS 9459]
MSCKYADVASCLERTDPHHPPSFYNALEMVKRYARAKIAGGKCRQLYGRGGKLEDLEQRFAHQGYQDIFYLTRLHLRLPPSTLDLPNPSCPVRKTLLKAGYPLPPQPECSAGPSRPSALRSASRPTSPKSRPLPEPEIIRRGSASLDLSGPIGNRSRSHDSPTKPAPLSGGMTRSTSSRPDLPSLKTTNITSPARVSRATSTLSPKSYSTGSSPISPALSLRSHGSNSSRWTPLLSGLGIKLFDHHHDPHLYDTAPPDPRVPFVLDPFAKDTSTPTLLKTPSTTDLTLPLRCSDKSCEVAVHQSGSVIAALEVVITRPHDMGNDVLAKERGFSLLEALGETEKDLESLCIAQRGPTVIH